MFVDFFPRVYVNINRQKNEAKVEQFNYAFFVSISKLNCSKKNIDFIYCSSFGKKPLIAFINDLLEKRREKKAIHYHVLIKTLYRICIQLNIFIDCVPPNCRQLFTTTLLQIKQMENDVHQSR